VAVDRCVCHDVRFSKLKAMAERAGGDLDALSRKTGVGNGCGMCIPYIKVMLRTGQTEIPVMRPEQIRALLEQDQASA
jgi:bacterioferritin-associated ferredoxin